MTEENLYISLLENINYLLKKNEEFDTKEVLSNKEEGVPNEIELTILLLYKLVINNNYLINKKIENKTLYDYLLILAKFYANDDYNDYCNDFTNYTESIIDYIINIWMNNITVNDFYQGNNCYEILGIVQIKLKKMIMICSNLNNI